MEESKAKSFINIVKSRGYKEVYMRTQKDGNTFFWGGTPSFKEVRATVIATELKEFTQKLDEGQILYVDLSFINFRKAPFVQMPNLKREVWAKAIQRAKEINKEIGDVIGVLVYLWMKDEVKISGQA